MDQVEREALIQQYAEGYVAIAAALEGATDADLDAREAEGEWSPREVVHHLADSEMTSAIRIRRLIAEEAPLIQGYDQEEFARKLAYDRPIEPSQMAFRYARESTVELLRRMTEDDWARAGTHSERGRYSAEDWLMDYSVHAHDHADQIRRARAAVAVGQIAG
jgi:hypothetical protein